MEIPFSGTYTRDYIKGASDVARQSTRLFKILRWTLLALLLGGAGFITYLSFTGKTAPFMDAIRIATWGVLIVYFALRFLFSGRAQAQTIWQQIGANPVVEGDVTPFGIRMEMAGSPKNIAWNQVIHVERLRGTFIFLINDGSFFALPQVFLKNPEDWKPLRELINQQMKVLR